MENGDRKVTGSPPLYNIKAVVMETGLKPPTIRAWERRYGFPAPRRSDGGHRQYSQRDIDTLKWLLARQEEGMTISYAIDLWRSMVERGEDPLQAQNRKTSRSISEVDFIGNGSQLEALRTTWIASCLSFDRELAERVLGRAFALFAPELVCVELLQNGLAEVGSGWYRGEVSIQQEHFTSALTIQRLETLIAAAPPPTRSERMIVSTAPGDFHTFSPLLLTFLLRRRGWDVVYLGADVPAQELESTINQIKPRLLIISAQQLHTAAALKDVAQSAADQGVIVAFGGLVFNHLERIQQLIPAHFLGRTIEDAVWTIEQMIETPLLISPTAETPVSVRESLAQYNERRSMIESHVWGTCVATNRPSEKLTAINSDFARVITAALKLGDIDLLEDNMAWVEHLLISYRMPSEFMAFFVTAYFQAAKVYLGPSNLIVEWLGRLTSGIEGYDRPIGLNAANE